MADVDGAGFADVFDPHPVGVNGDRVVPRGGHAAWAAPGRPRPLRERRDGGIGPAGPLAGPGGGGLAREAAPLTLGRGGARAPRTDRAVAPTPGGGGGPDAERGY